MEYLSGLNNTHQSEAKGYAGILPVGQFNKQTLPHGIVAEQLSGTAFTAPRAKNKRAWLYRLKPSVGHEPFELLPAECQLDYESSEMDPNQKRWFPFRPPEKLLNRFKCYEYDFIEGLTLLAHSESARNLDGGPNQESVSVFVYFATKSMQNKSFCNAEGDMLIVPQEGSLLIITEFGSLRAAPNEIVVIQQGMRFQVCLDENKDKTREKPIRGYVLEVTGNHFELPELGVIGANGLANDRDFQVPTARVEDETSAERAESETNEEETFHEIVMKTGGKLWTCKQVCSPYQVAAWIGNYYPYKYSLDRFVSVNSVSRDHPDPSIFTVLTCPSNKPGTALADFVIFPPRWDCANDTFRPPYFHRNCMTEFMGLIRGKYLAKSEMFAPGGGSLHQMMIPHGPDLECYEAAIREDTSVPKRVADNAVAFMFETSLPLKLTRYAREQNVDKDYYKCWQGY